MPRPSLAAAHHEALQQNLAFLPSAERQSIVLEAAGRILIATRGTQLGHVQKCAEEHLARGHDVGADEVYSTSTPSE